MSADAIFQLVADDGPWVLLVFFLLWRDLHKEAEMRTAFNKNALVLNEIATVIRERLPQAQR